MIILAKYTIYNAGAPKILVLSLSGRLLMVELMIKVGVFEFHYFACRENKVTVRFQFSNHTDIKYRETCREKRDPQLYFR